MADEAAVDRRLVRTRDARAEAVADGAWAPAGLAQLEDARLDREAFQCSHSRTFWSPAFKANDAQP